jgi:hypothetical protein
MLRRTLRWIWLMPIAVTGCGDSSTPPQAKITRPNRAIWCPTSSGVTDPPGRLSRPNRPAPGSFDTRSLLGQTAHEAAAEARRHGCV